MADGTSLSIDPYDCEPHLLIPQVSLLHDGHRPFSMIQTTQTIKNIYDYTIDSNGCEKEQLDDFTYESIIDHKERKNQVRSNAFWSIHERTKQPRTYERPDRRSHKYFGRKYCRRVWGLIWPPPWAEILSYRTPSTWFSSGSRWSALGPRSVEREIISIYPVSGSIDTLNLSSAAVWSWSSLGF